MSTITQLVKELSRADHITRRIKLADVEAVYGKGFAESLRRKLAADDNAKMANVSAPTPRAKYRGR